MAQTWRTGTEQSALPRVLHLGFVVSALLAGALVTECSGVTSARVG